ncbi:MAG: FHA domain-containing protein [Pirellulaceae bacterium]
MALKLRVLHGSLRQKHGGSAGADVKVKDKRFVIGSATDSNLRCPSSSISPEHCEILPEMGGHRIRDLGSETGTFVNGERLVQPRRLQHGDVLRVGRLEFEVIIDAPVPPPAPPREDPVGDRISEMLVEADREERAERFEDPSKRQFALKKPQSENAGASAESPKKSFVRPPRRPPQKLPPPPRIVKDSTVEAAEEVLKKFFEKPRK